MEKILDKLPKPAKNGNMFPQTEDMFSGRVYQTMEYSKFKLIPGNRIVKRDKQYYDLINSLKTCDLKEPILVTKDYFIIDGQHRLQARKDLLLPVYYIFTDAPATPESVMHCNKVRRSWTWKATATLYNACGRSDYGEFLEYVERYDMKFIIALPLLANGSVFVATSDLQNKFYDGKFQINHMDFAIRFAEYINNLSRDSANKTIYKSRTFIIAFGNCWKNEKFQAQRFLSQAKKYSNLATNQATVAQYQDMIHIIYNYKSKEASKINLRAI